ncbi:MAG: hypothetical protein INR62_04415 [Rhodospirillales bacterium]|nr:hypothetical protein [Acetobacter sp.]
MPDNARTVDVTIPVDADVAPALENALTRSLARRLVSRMLEPPSIEHLFEVIDAMKAEAHRRGLMDEMFDAELEAYNAERRERPVEG